LRGPDKAEASIPEAGFRQAMTALHTWAGLTLGWVLYFMFLTGTAGYFDTEIDRWMRPELPAPQTNLSAADTAAVLLARLREEAPAAERWFITLPADRNNPYPQFFWQGAGASGDRLTVDASSGEAFAARDTGGGQWLYQMHWRLHAMPRSVSNPIVGFATLFMLVALVTGVIIHKKIFRDFFTFRPGRGRRSWLDAHTALGVIALPFHLMITYSGLILLGFSLMPLVVAAHYGFDPQGRQQFIAEVFDPPGLLEPAGEAAPLAPPGPMIATAESRWGEGRVLYMDVRHPGDRNARVVLHENTDRAVTTGREQLVFDGVSGALLHAQPPASTATAPSAAKGARDLLIGLHEGLFAPPLLRWLYFFSGLLGAAMVATGLVLWTVKRRQQAARGRGGASAGLRLVERLNTGAVAGLPIAIAAYFWANRLLPVDLAQRADWEVRAMFLAWLAMLIHAARRPPARSWAEQFGIAACAYGLLPLLNLLTTDRHLGHSLAAGDWAFAGFDLTALAIGLAFGWGAGRLRRAPLAAREYPPQTAVGEGL